MRKIKELIQLFEDRLVTDRFSLRDLLGADRDLWGSLGDGYTSLRILKEIKVKSKEPQMNPSFERLDRKELQRLCLKVRKAGYLPKRTKCNGSREELLEILQGKSPYENIFPHLAPYLSLDKLLLGLAYFPRSSLRSQAEDPQGALWASRVWVEAGEPPLSLNPGGIRYYHLWQTESLGPWGYFHLTDDRYGTLRTKVWCRWIWADYSRDPTLEVGSLKVWALTPQGLEYLNLRDFQLSHLLEAINERDNWSLVVREDIVSVIYKDPGCFVLLRKGILIEVTLEDDHFDRWGVSGVPPIRYIRETSFGSYLIDSRGRHAYLRDQAYLEYPRLERTGGYFTLRGGPLDRFYVKLSKPRKEVLTVGGLSVENLDPLEEIPEMREDTLYLLPDPLKVAEVEEEGALPKRGFIYWDSFMTQEEEYLGIDGRIYSPEGSRSRERYALWKRKPLGWTWGKGTWTYGIVW